MNDIIRSMSFLMALICIVCISLLSCNKRNGPEDNAVVRNHPYANAPLVITKFLAGEYSLSFINDRKAMIAEEAVMYANLWHDLDNCHVTDSNQQYEYLESIYFNIAKKGENTVILSKIHKDLLLFKLLIINNKPTDAAEYASTLDLNDYGRYRFYPILLKMLAGHYDNRFNITQEETSNSVAKDSFPAYKAYNLVWAFAEWEKGNIDSARTHLKNFEISKSDNIFLNDIFKVLNAIIIAKSTDTSCFQRKLLDYLSVR